MLRVRRSALLLLVLSLIFVISCWRILLESELDNLPYSEQDLSTDHDAPFYVGCQDVDEYMKHEHYTKANASFVMLTRNEELIDVIKTIRSIETKFNSHFRYPYVFLNDVPFTDEFIRQVSKSTGAQVEFGTIDEVDWNFPKEVAESLEYRYAMNNQGDRGIMYANMESYHKMCRFYSGIFFRHPLITQYEWYWRLEPNVEFTCDISYDPFHEMDLAGKSYGFTVLIPEFYWTVPNLFRYTRGFIKRYSVELPTLWRLFTNDYHVLETSNEYLRRRVNYNDEVDEFLQDEVNIEHTLNNDHTHEYGLNVLVERSKHPLPILEDKFDDEEYNLCHFWSNFEIAKVSLFNNDFYLKYFEYLEQSGGFWRERWGDAPVHSLALGMMLDIDDVHYFRDIGYRHSTIEHCPYNVQEPVPENQWKLHTRLRTYIDKTHENGCGCRCKCNHKADIEDQPWPCIEKWLKLVHEVFDEDNFDDGSYKPRFDAETLLGKYRHAFYKQRFSEFE